MDILKKDGTLRFFGEWFGRPGDNFHRPISAEISENVLVILFDGGENAPFTTRLVLSTSRTIFTSKAPQKLFGNGIITAENNLPKTFADAYMNAYPRTITRWNCADFEKGGGVYLNLLFLCSQNKRRSFTAEKLFDGCNGHNARSAGTENNARIKVTAGLIGWADVIFCMEKKHLQRIREKYADALAGKQVITLNIPDDYEFMDEELQELLLSAVCEYL